MAIARVTSVGAGNAGATTLVLDPAATPAERDLVICCVSVRGGSGTSIKWSVAFQQAGLTNPTVDSTTVLRQAVYWRWAGANEPTSYTATFSSSQKASGACTVFSGVDMAQPFDVSSGQANGTSTTITAAGITVATANCWLVGFFGTAFGTTIATYTSPLVERSDAPSTSGTTSLLTTTAGADSNGVVSTGATGNKTALAANAAANIGHLLAIRPRTDGTTVTVNVAASSDDAVATNISTAASITDTAVSLGERGTDAVSGMRFNAVTVPNAATINWAYVLVRATSTYSPAHASVIETDLSCEAADDAATFSTAGANLNVATRPRTTAKTTNWRLHDTFLSIDEVLPITSAVQEVINRAGWASGNDLVVLGDDSASTASEWQDFASFDHTTILEPRLVINYTSAGGGGVTVDATASPASAAGSAVNPSVVQASLTLNLTGVVATATSSAVTPSVGQGSLTVNATAAPATASGTAIDPTVSLTGGGVSVDLTSLPASATSSAVSPTVVQGSVTINASAVVAAAAGTAVSPTVTITGGGVTVNLSSAPATASSSAISPTVRQASLTLNLTASPAAATGAAVTPTVTLGGGGLTVNLSAVPASAVSSAVTPSVRQSSLVVAAAAASAVASAITPTVRQGSLSVNLASLPALAIGTALTPTTIVAAAAARATGLASGRRLLWPMTAGRATTLPRTSGRIATRPRLTARATTRAATSGRRLADLTLSGSEHS